MVTPHERLRTLVEGLYLATERGNLRWSANNGTDTYFAQIGANRVEIIPVGNDIRINVYGPTGDEVDTFDDNYFKGMAPVNIPHETYYQAMVDLHQSARRSATGADRVIDDMISILGIDPVRDDLPF